MKENEKFQFSTFADKLEMFKASRGRTQVLNMVEHLNKLKIEGNSYFFVDLPLIVI